MNLGDTTCGGCGNQIDGEPPSGEPAFRRPCSQCGSLVRKFALSAHAISHATATAELSVTTYPQTLLITAKDLFDRGQFGISVVVAHMACEVATERTLSEAFTAKSVEYLEEPILSFLNGFSLASERNRKLYNALTGDPIEKQPFWQAFKTSAARRNGIIHQSKIIGAAEAEESLSAASSYINHLKK